VKKVGTKKWQQATTVRRRKREGEWVSNGDLYRAISAGYNHFLAQRTRSGALSQEAIR
jgi:hypothetical protein